MSYEMRIIKTCGPSPGHFYNLDHYELGWAFSIVSP